MSGTASGGHRPGVRPNVIEVLVTAKDGITKTYTVAVTRATPSPACGSKA